MKLGALKSAIRDNEGPPRAWMNMPGADCAVDVALVKSVLLDRLDEAYSGGRSVETGLEFVNGILKPVEK